MTPYLILDNGMLDTLTRAAKSGIEVCIIMPHIPDKWYAFAVAKTYYRELIEAGVNIYEFTPGFVHAKVFVSDDDTATVGTVNLDYRSLYLHFECGIFVYDNPVVHKIEKDFQETLKKSLIFLFIVDIKDDSILCTPRFKNSKLWSFKQIEENLGKGFFSSCFEDEYEHLKGVIYIREKYRES